MTGPLEWVAVVLAGLAGGFVNTVAGGASLIGLPVLVWLGLPATVANATNNVATTAQSIAAAVGYARRGFGAPRATLILLLPGAVGAAVGASVVVALPEAVFRRVVALFMVAALVVVLRPPPAPRGPRTVRRVLTAVAVGLLGVYGGFFGGGVGLVLLPLVATGLALDYVTANGVKSAVAAAMNATAFVVFVASGLVAWRVAVVFVVAMVLGAQMGVRMAVRRGSRWVRGVLVVVTIAAVPYFWWR